MEERKIEGTYSESKIENTWTGHYYECNECGYTFMTEDDMDKCFCPNCGKYLIWKDALNDVE